MDTFSAVLQVVFSVAVVAWAYSFCSRRTQHRRLRTVINGYQTMPQIPETDEETDADMDDDSARQLDSSSDDDSNGEPNGEMMLRPSDTEED